MQVLVLSARGIFIGSKICVIVFLVLRSEIVDRILAVVCEKEREREREKKKDLWYIDVWND